MKMSRMVYRTAIAIIFVASTLLLLSLPTVDAVKNSQFTIYERQTEEGPRHSPLFTLPVGCEEEECPSKMILFSNDLYGSKDGLIEEDLNELIGYNQGHCIETMVTEGLFAECYFTFVFDGGSMTANGPFNFSADSWSVVPSVLAVTGGTGSYMGANGETALSAGPAENFTSLQFDFNVKTFLGKK